MTYLHTFLVFSQASSVVILEERDPMDDSTVEFWPGEGTEGACEFGPFLVEHIATDEKDFFKVVTLKLHGPGKHDRYSSIRQSTRKLARSDFLNFGRSFLSMLKMRFRISRSGYMADM